MIYKVLYQQIYDEIPVRERTTSMYYEAKTERQVRKELAAKNVNIEFVQPLDEAHLAYEKQSEDFYVENA